MQNDEKIIMRLKNTWNNMEKKKKLIFAILVALFLLAIIIYYIVFSRITYVTLFNDLDITDSSKVVQKIEEKGNIDYKIADGGRTILVSEDKVDKIRLDLAMEDALPSSGSGYEIFDGSSFAVTDDERKIMYQRALQGELQQTIMSFEEVAFARIHLSMPKETIFSRDTQQGSASITLKLEPFETLSNEQVRGIISLVSGAINGIPEKNVRVLDANANLLSDGVLSPNGDSNVASYKTQMENKRDFEQQLSKQVEFMLERALGQEKVLVKINADIDFESEESTSIIYDYENPVIRSKQEIVNITKNTTDAQGSSAVDNNFQSVINDLNNLEESQGINAYESVKNYEIGETTISKFKAPGQILRLTTSVIYDGELSQDEMQAVRNIVIAAVGYDEARGDMLSVEAMIFDRTYEEKLNSEIEKLALDELLANEKMKKIYTIIASGIFAIFCILIIARLFRKRRGSKVGNENLIEGNQMVQQPIKLDEIMIEDVTGALIPNSENNMEKEINQFVEKSPERVAEIVKTWILKDEG